MTAEERRAAVIELRDWAFDLERSALDASVWDGSRQRKTERCALLRAVAAELDRVRDDR